jgi:antitoxin HicB
MMTRPPVSLAWPVQLDADEEGPDFGVGVTQGDDREEALATGADVLDTMVANRMAEGWGLPGAVAGAGATAGAARTPRRRQGESVPGHAPGGIEKPELARRLEIAAKNIDRLFSIHHMTRFEQIEAALAVVGRRLVVSVAGA